MKNIFEIMKEYGLEVPEEKKKDFEKTVLDNYKTVSDYEIQSEKLKTTEGKVTTLTESSHWRSLKSHWCKPDLRKCKNHIHR